MAETNQVTDRQPDLRKALVAELREIAQQISEHAALSDEEAAALIDAAHTKARAAAAKRRATRDRCSDDKGG
jgi:hypothetical protein